MKHQCHWELETAWQHPKIHKCWMHPAGLHSLHNVFFPSKVGNDFSWMDSFWRYQFQMEFGKQLVTGTKVSFGVDRFNHLLKRSTLAIFLHYSFKRGGGFHGIWAQFSPYSIWCNMDTGNYVRRWVSLQFLCQITFMIWASQLKLESEQFLVPQVQSSEVAQTMTTYEAHVTLTFWYWPAWIRLGRLISIIG